MDEETNGIAKIFIWGAVLMTLIIFFALTTGSAVEKEEKRECLQWQKLSQELRADLFFLTPSQKKQCNVHGIKIDAPVKGGGYIVRNSR